MEKITDLLKDIETPNVSRKGEKHILTFDKKTKVQDLLDKSEIDLCRGFEQYVIKFFDSSSPKVIAMRLVIFCKRALELEKKRKAKQTKEGSKQTKKTSKIVINK